MNENGKEADTVHTFLEESEERRLTALFAYLEKKIPAAYRVELLSYLLPRAIPRASMEERQPPFPTAPAAHFVAAHLEAELPLEESAPRVLGHEEGQPAVALHSYLPLFARRGKTLLKALATIWLAETRLGVSWLTPAEIVRLQEDFDADHKVYRSNVSNVLRKETALISRRPRGRGYEYGLTRAGRDRVERELTLLGIDR